jgi:uncharacterized protein involved in outer membrane biogenesis
MPRIAKWLLALVGLLIVLLAAVAVALHLWIGTDDFRARVAREVSAAAGVPVELGGLSVDVWPLPAVAADRVLVRSQPALTLERIEARPMWVPLLQGRLEVATLLVRNAVIPQDAIAAVGAAHRKAHPEKPGQARKADVAFAFPRRIVLDKVTWVDGKGNRSVVDAQAHLDDDGLPELVDFSVTQGRWQGVQAKLQREADHWSLRGKVGGGSIEGKLRLVKGAKGASALDGQFDTANVEVSTFTAPSRTLTGHLEAHTTVHADLRDLGAIADVAQSQTKFTIHNAVLHGIDLAQAVKTVGMNRSGETQLDTLAGNLITHGRAAELTNLVASSGVLSANGHVAMAADKRLSGSVAVSLTAAAAGGALAVSLAVGGTLDAPAVTLSKGALVGAAIGTAIAPGLGTGAGAKLGDQLGQGLKGLFGK